MKTVVLFAALVALVAAFPEVSEQFSKTVLTPSSSRTVLSKIVVLIEPNHHLE